MMNLSAPQYSLVTVASLMGINLTIAGVANQNWKYGLVLALAVLMVYAAFQSGDCKTMLEKGFWVLVAVGAVMTAFQK